MATVSISISADSVSSTNASWGTEYDYATYGKLYVGDTFTVSCGGTSGGNAYGFYYTSAVLDGFTQTSKSSGGNTVYGMTGTLAEDHLGSHYGTMARVRIVGKTTGSKFRYTVYGKYKAIVAYNANGGGGAPSSQSSTTDSTTKDPTISITLSSTKPTKSNATFKGWSTSSTASTSSYSPGTEYSFASTLAGKTTTLYAVYWTNWKAYLKYDANTGSDAPPQQSATVTQYNQPSAKSFTISVNIPTLTGYKFLGWSTTKYTPGTGTATYQPSGTISVAYSAAGTTTTLYAVWEKYNAHIKVGGAWKYGFAWVKVSGVWKKAKAVWKNVGGIWKKGV